MDFFLNFVYESGIFREMLARTEYKFRVNRSLEDNPVTALVGSRQSGKTTLAREIAEDYKTKGSVHYFDLENPEHLLALENPMRALENLHGLIVIDEVQRKADIFPLLRVLADRHPLQANFLVLGSASGDLLQQTSESLAGRIEYIELPGFGIEEIEEDQQEQLWIHGGYPKSFLAKDAERSYRWREQFIQTFLERDIGLLNLKSTSTQLWRFWQMVAHFHGQTCNYSAIGASLDISHTTVKRYLDILTNTFMIRQLAPWFENVGKTIVKSPKIYIRDSGLLHTLLNIRSMEQLRKNPRLGFSWEGFALEQIIRLSGQTRNIFFWSTHSGAEMDLIMNIGGERWGFEIKYSDAPKRTKSMTIAKKDLNLNRIYVVYPGNSGYYLGEGIEAIPLKDIRRIFAEK